MSESVQEVASNELLVSDAEGVRTVTFHRPRRRNALTRAMYDGLAQALREADAASDIRVVVVTGCEGVFTSGNDLMDFMQDPPTGEDSPVVRLLTALVEFGKPLVAVVNGTAVGVGVTMLPHCDLVYAADTAQFQLPFVSLGLVPEGGSSLLLPALMGTTRASELLMLGEKFDAAEAMRVGLVARVFSADTLAAGAGAAIARLAAQPLQSLVFTKRLLREPQRAAVREAMRREGALFIERLTSPAAMEAFGAFFEKRTPDFRSVGE